MGEQIWYEDIAGFFHPNNAVKIWWSASDSAATRLNVMFRFAVYYAVTLSLFVGRSWPMTIPIYVGLFTLLVHKNKLETSWPGGSERSRAYEGSKWTMPTTDNPVMNFTVGDLMSDNAERPPAANVLKHDVQQRISDKYAAGIPHDNTDIFGRNTGERTFYTMPCTSAVNDADKFARWLFPVSDKTKWKERGVLFHGARMSD